MVGLAGAGQGVLPIIQSGVFQVPVRSGAWHITSESGIVESGAGLLIVAPGFRISV